MKNATYEMKFIEWQNSWQLKSFDNAWLYAQMLFSEYAGESPRFEYDWT